MKINIQEVKVKISKNEYNKHFYWNPRCLLLNTCEIERNGIWYKSSISFIKKENEDYIQISDLMQIGENRRIDYHEKGLFKELPISRFKKQVIEVLMNNHFLNYKWFKFREKTYERRNTIFVFSFSIILAIVYYLGNEHYNNSWAKYIVDNSVIQSLFLLLNIFTIGSVFFPFTIQKQLNEIDIRELFKEEIKKYDEEKRRNERVNGRSRF